MRWLVLLVGAVLCALAAGQWEVVAAVAVIVLIVTFKDKGL